MKTIIRQVAVALGIFATAYGCIAADEAGDHPRVITVFGTAVQHVRPDVMNWYLDVDDFDKNVVSAKRRNDQRVKALLDLCKELNISTNDVETGIVSVSREYERDKEGKRLAFRHYAVRRSLVIRMRDFDRFDEFLTAAISSASPELNLDFGSTQIEQIRAEVRLKAMAAAKDKAQQLAKVVGAEVGNALEISERSLSGFGGGGGGGGGDNPEADVGQSTLVLGDVEVRVTMFAKFELK